MSKFEEKVEAEAEKVETIVVASLHEIEAWFAKHFQNNHISADTAAYNTVSAAKADLIATHAQEVIVEPAPADSDASATASVAVAPAPVVAAAPAVEGEAKTDA